MSGVSQVFLLAFVVSVQPQPTASNAIQPTALYERVMERALSQAETDLLAGKDFWVDHSTWSNAWLVESEHYSVRTTVNRYVAQKIANDLEFMLSQFQAILDTNFTPAQRFEIWILPTLPDYNTEGANADEHSTFYASFVSGTHVATYYSPNLSELGMWVTHSAFHQFFSAAFRRTAPLWIAEGLAGYFALYWDWQWGAVQFERIKSSNYTPIQSLVSAPLAAYTEDRVIELGMFFKYLLHYRDDTRLAGEGEAEPDASFVSFLRQALRGGGSDTAFYQAVMRGDLDALDAEFRAFEF